MTPTLKKYQSKIAQLNPLTTSSFNYDAIRWSKLNPKAKASVSAFENKKISRQDVLAAYETYYHNEVDVIHPFTLTMIWGFSDNGYGTYRTNKYLETDKNSAAIKTSLDLVKADKLKEAYKTLQQIDGINISYISKILYFATRAAGHTHYALIFDIRVARALVTLLDPTIASILEITPSPKFTHYIAYNTLLHKWAKELNVEAEAIEQFLFEGKFT